MFITLSQHLPLPMDWSEKNTLVCIGKQMIHKSNKKLTDKFLNLTWIIICFVFLVCHLIFNIWILWHTCWYDRHQENNPIPIDETKWTKAFIM